MTTLVSENESCHLLGPAKLIAIPMFYISYPGHIKVMAWLYTEHR